MADEKTLHIKADVQGGDADLEAAESAIFNEAVSNAEAMKALESFIFATEEMKDKFDSEQPEAEKRKPGRPRIHPLPTPEEEETRRKRKGLNSLLDNFQKVVIALNGTNGRTTKAMAVFNRVIKFSAESLENYSKAQKAAQETAENVQDSTEQNADAEKKYSDFNKQANDDLNNTNSGGGGNQPPDPPSQGPPSDDDNGGNRFSKLWAGLNTGAKALGANFTAVAATGATVVGGFAAVSTATILFGKLLTNTARSLVQMTDGFSAAVNVAKAQSEIALMQAKMRTANEAGSELAQLENASSNFEVAVQDFWTKLTEMFGPLISGMLDILTSILNVVNVILSVINLILSGLNNLLSGFLTVLEYMPFIGDSATTLKKIFALQKTKDANDIADLNKNFGQLFDAENIGLEIDEKRAKHLRKRGFLQ